MVANVGVRVSSRKRGRAKGQPAAGYWPRQQLGIWNRGHPGLIRAT